MHWVGAEFQVTTVSQTDQRRADFSRSLLNKMFNFCLFRSQTFLLFSLIAMMFYWPLGPLIFCLTTMVCCRLHLVLISMHKINNQRRWHVKGRRGAVNLWCSRVAMQWKSLVSIFAVIRKPLILIYIIYKYEKCWKILVDVLDCFHLFIFINGHLTQRWRNIHYVYFFKGYLLSLVFSSSKCIWKQFTHNWKTPQRVEIPHLFSSTVIKTHYKNGYVTFRPPLLWIWAWETRHLLDSELKSLWII